MKITFSSGEEYTLEKNQVVQFYPTTPDEKKPQEKMNVTTPNCTFLEFISRAEHSLSEGVFWRYDPFNNHVTNDMGDKAGGTNCQGFVIACLKANGILTPELQKFVLQDTKNLVPKFYERFARNVTDLVSNLTDRYGVEDKGGPVQGPSRKDFSVNPGLEPNGTSLL